MLGAKINKPVITQEECDNYSQVAEWCNNNNCHIEDREDYYEVVENPPAEEFPVEETPSQLDRIEAQVMFTALMTDTLIESEVE